MRFISPIAVLFAGVAESSAVCSEDIIHTADGQNFVRAIINCMRVTGPGPETCLSRFIADNAVGNPFPITDGACRDAYQDMLNTWLTDGIGTLSQYCLASDLGPTDPISFGCVDGKLNDGMLPFQLATGFFPTTFCSPAQVRARARDDRYFATNIAKHVAGIPYWTPQTEACDSCYSADVFASYFAAFRSGASASALATANPAVVAGCTDPNGPNEDCMRSTTMIDARRFFAACAGYDILFEGPVCSANQIALVEAMVPKPFYTLAYCAYNPRVPFCTTIDAYVENIETITSVDCVACYTELNTDLAALALLDTTGICSPNVLSDSCLTYVASALTNFESCSGITIATGSAE